MKKRGRPRKNQEETIPTVIDFSQIVKLKSIQIDDRMMEQMESGLVLDLLISHEGGMPCATNTRQSFISFPYIRIYYLLGLF